MTLINEASSLGEFMGQQTRWKIMTNIQPQSLIMPWKKSTRHYTPCWLWALQIIMSASHNGTREVGVTFLTLQKGEIETGRAEAALSEISDANPDLPLLTTGLLTSSQFSIPGEELNSYAV